MFGVYNLFNQAIGCRTKESITSWRTDDSNPYLYPAMKECIKSIRRNHGTIVDPVDGSTAKVRAVVETKDGDVCAWLDTDKDVTFTISKINVIKGLPLVTEGISNDGKNAGSIERSIRHYNDTHGYVIVSWIAC